MGRWVGTGGGAKEEADIGDGAGHGPMAPSSAKGPAGRREMAGGGNAARSGFQGANACEMSGSADGAAAVTA